MYIVTRTSICIYLAIQCGNATEVTHGKIVYPNGTQENQVALYTCDDGYVLEGPDMLRCNATGHWTPDAPVCEASGKMLNLVL